MLGTLHRLTSGATLAITQVTGNGYTGVVVHTTNPGLPVGTSLTISEDAYDAAQTVELTAATIDMLVYHVPRNSDRKLAHA